MTDDFLFEKCKDYLKTLCVDIAERCVGSNGNRQATNFLEKELSLRNWKTEMVEFDAIDWEENGARLKSDQKYFDVLVSPYSLSFKGEGELISASTFEELSKINAKNKIIFLLGEIALEQLMPKNFVFYNPEEHQKIIKILENSGAKAIISATGRNAALAGGVYPFPLIEDGDFDIPSVYMTEEEGAKLIPEIGKIVFLESLSKRIPGKGYNVIAEKGNKNSPKIVVTAHIDAKKGTNGAIDNATGVIALLLLSDLLKDYNGNKLIELVAFNGEDYYAVPGQMSYISNNKNNFNNMILKDLGLTDDLAAYINDNNLSGFSVGRVTQEHRERYIVSTGDNEFDAEITGNLRFSANSRSDFPAVGDWVTMTIYETDLAIIHGILPRKSVLERQAVGKTGEIQIISANIDVAFIIQAINNNFSINRLERYLSVCHSSNIEPVMVISKIDLSTDREIHARKGSRMCGN